MPPEDVVETKPETLIPAEPEIFPGNNEIAAFLQAYDWASTELGPPEQWPQALKTAVYIALTSRFPLWVGCGKDLHIVYNEGFVQVLADKHPWAAGRPVKEVWHEVWDVISPMLTGVLEREEASWLEDSLLILQRKNNTPEETYFTYSYSPIKEENEIVGVFTTVAETTERVIGERRLKTLRDLGAQATSKIDSPEASCQEALKILVKAKLDVPYAALFLSDDSEKGNRFCEATYPDIDPTMWPVKEVMQTSTAQVLEGMANRAKILDPHWQRPIDRFIVLPLGSKGHKEGVRGVLVAGVSPLRPLDEEYRVFYELAANQIGTAITNANAAKALKESQEQHILVVQGANDGIWDWDFRTNKTYWNDRFLEMLGLDRAQVPETSSDFGWSLIHPDDLPKVQEAFKAHLEKRVPYKMELRMRHSSGEYRYIRATAQAAWDDEGKPLRIAGASADITEQKLAEQALFRSERQLQDFFDTASVGLHWIGPDGTILRANQAELDLLGYTAEEFVGRNIAEFHVDETVIDEMLARLCRDEKLQDYQARLRCKDGSIRHVLINSSVYWENGEFIHTRCFTRDVTELKKAAETIAESERRYRLLVSGITDYAIFMEDPQGFITSWDEGAQRMFGYSAEEILGQPFSRFHLPEDIQAGLMQKELETASKEGRIETEGWRLRKDGSTFRAKAVLRAVYDENNNLIGFAKIVQDITEQKRAEEELLSYSQLLRRSNKELEEFATIASHDLQAPLRKVMTFSDMLRSVTEGQLPKEAEEYIDRIQKGTGRMQELITDLLSLSRVTRNVNPFKPTDLSAVVAEILEDLDLAIQEKKAVIELGELCTLDADTSQLKQLFSNLIGNALKFTVEGQVPKIQISSRIINQCCEITVKDNGIGFKPELNERIFKAFERAHGNTVYPGTGIGLTIVKKIVERHSGTIQANGLPNEGAIFTIRLPLKQEKHARQEAIR